MLELPPWKEAIVPILALNTSVFLLFLLPSARLSLFLYRHWVHSPALSGKNYTMLTSTFSHQSFIHFAFNNLALWSFGAMPFLSPEFRAHAASALTSATGASSSSAWFGRPDVQVGEGRSLTPPLPFEPSITPHFLAFFALAGTFSSYLSQLMLTLRMRRYLRLTSPAHLPPNAHNDLQRAMGLRKLGAHASLGSSGAIYAGLVMSSLAFPQASVGLIFLPFVSFPIGAGVGAMVALDVVGIIRGWKMFDHWAHLG